MEKAHIQVPRTSSYTGEDEIVVVRDSWGVINFASHQPILVILELSFLFLLLFRHPAFGRAGLNVVEGILHARWSDAVAPTVNYGKLTSESKFFLKFSTVSPAIFLPTLVAAPVHQEG